MGLMNFMRPGAMMASEDVSRDASDDRIFSGFGARSEIRVDVTIARARQVPVVRSCLKVLADSVAGLQFGTFRRVNEHEVTRLTGHPAARLLENPNQDQTSFDFVYSIVDDLAAHGDFFAEISYDEAQNPIALHRIENPQAVQVERLMDGSKRIRFTRRGGAEKVLVTGEFWHIAMPPFVDNMRGSSPILHDGKEAVAVAIALQRYANILFTNDATPPYAFSMEGSFKDQQSKKNFMSALRRWMGGANRHTPGVLEYGMKPHRMGLTAEEAQFLETRKELWLDLARLWRVPPHKVGIMDRATFSNIEHQSLEFVIDTLRPILELIERSVTKFLINEDDIFFEFNVESLLRGDIKTRYEAYALGRQWGWLSVNDVLRMENRNGIGPIGDRYIEPLNMVPAGTGGRDEAERKGVQDSISFLRESVARNGGRPRLELVKDVA
jgi:HK97 family phage portal protein